MVRGILLSIIVVLALLPAGTHGESTIDVTVSAPTTETGDCRIPLHGAPAESGWTVRWATDSDIAAVARQVIVSDASGDIVAVADLVGAVEDDRCVASVALAVPDSAFVTVRLDDQHIATVQRDQLATRHALLITIQAP